MIDAIVYAFKFVSNAHFFWQSMGITTISAMFIGAVMYDGILPKAAKAAVNILLYSGLLALTHLTRIYPNLYIYSELPPSTHAQVYAGLATTLYISLAYVTGILLGVLTVWVANRKCKGNHLCH